MITFKRAIKQLFGNRKYPGKMNMKDKSKMKKNIYDSPDLKNHFKKWQIIHYVFKYRMMMPFMWLSNLFIKKHLPKNIPDYEWNVNIKVFDKAFEQSIEDWCINFRRHLEIHNGMRTKHWWKAEAKKGLAPKMLRWFKQVYLMMILNDTAYRELHNFLMHNIAKEMIKEYQPDKKRNKGIVRHLCYSAQDIYDVDYFMLFKKVRIDTGVFLKRGDSGTDQENAPSPAHDENTPYVKSCNESMIKAALKKYEAENKRGKKK